MTAMRRKADAFHDWPVRSQSTTPDSGLSRDLASRYHGAVKLSQRIRFCTSADGTRIATASCGEGPVILRTAHWLSHVDYDRNEAE